MTLSRQLEEAVRSPGARYFLATLDRDGHLSIRLFGAKEKTRAELAAGGVQRDSTMRKWAGGAIPETPDALLAKFKSEWPGVKTSEIVPVGGSSKHYAARSDELRARAAADREVEQKKAAERAAKRTAMPGREPRVKRAGPYIRWDEDLVGSKLTFVEAPWIPGDGPREDLVGRTGEIVGQGYVGIDAWAVGNNESPSLLVKVGSEKVAVPWSAVTSDGVRIVD